METEIGFISACMIVKNEGSTIANVVRALKAIPTIREVVVVDTGSTDNTPFAALTAGARVLYFPLTGDYGSARNFGITQISPESSWVFVLDADEKLTPQLAAWLAGFDGQSAYDGYAIHRYNTIDGEAIAFQNAHEWHTRLFRREYRYSLGLHESVAISPAMTCSLSDEYLIEHAKTSARQDRQNVWYDEIAADEGVYLNLGCGGRPIKGWVNVDSREVAGVDVVHDLYQPLPYEDGTVDRIWAAQIVEHFSYHHVSQVLGDWMRVLKPGGVIELSTPDIDAITSAYVRNRVDYLRFIQLMYGGQDTQFDYHFHVVNMAWITGQLLHYGCSDVERLPGEWWDLVVRGVKVDAS